MNRLEKWKGIWERKGRELKKGDLILRDLIAMDGFDTATETMTEETWINVVEMVKRKLNLRNGDFLLEVGCGAGAMLLPLSKVGREQNKL